MLTSATEHPLCVSLARSPESPRIRLLFCAGVADVSVCLRFRGLGSSARLFAFSSFGFSLFVRLFFAYLCVRAFVSSVGLVGSVVCLLLVLLLFVCVRVCLFVGLRLFVCGIRVCYALFGDDEALHPLLQPERVQSVL